MSLIFFDDFFAPGAIPENIAASSSGWNPTAGRAAGSGASVSTSSVGAGAWSHTAITTQFTGWAMYVTSYNTAVTLMSWWGDAGATQHLTLTFDASGHFQIRRGTASGTVLATSTNIFPMSAARSINTKHTIADSGGIFELKVDGVSWISFVGDTKNAGTNTTTDKTLFSTVASGFTFSDMCVFDDVDATATQGQPNNTYPGDKRCLRLMPNANGTYSDFLGSDGNSVNNYQQVDEVASSMTDYNGSATSAQKDSYAIEDLPLSVSAVVATRVALLAAKSDAGAGGISPLIRENSTDTFGTDFALSTSAAYYASPTYARKPSNNTLWTINDVNGTEIGVRSEAS